MARLKRPGIRVLFVGSADLESFAEGLGTFMPSPVTGPQVVEGVLQTLDTSPDIRRAPFQTSSRDQAQSSAIAGNEILGRTAAENATLPSLTSSEGSR